MVSVAEGTELVGVNIPHHSEHRIRRNRSSAHIVGLHRGHATGQGIVCRNQEHLGIFLVGIRLENCVGPVAGQFGENTVGLAVLILFPGAAGELGGSLGDTHQLQHLAVDGDHMTADTLQNDGNICRNFVQIPPGGQALVAHEQILVPAHRLNTPLSRLGMAFQKGFADLHQMIRRGGFGDVGLCHADAHH